MEINNSTLKLYIDGKWEETIFIDEGLSTGAADLIKTLAAEVVRLRRENYALLVKCEY